LKAYISVSYKHRYSLTAVLNAIKSALALLKIEALVFVDSYHFAPEDESEMMQQAMRDIDTCDILIAETSDKAIGIGVEVGYAKAKGKPVIYLRKQNAEHSTTVAGISDYRILYETEADLEQQLRNVLKNIRT